VRSGLPGGRPGGKGRQRYTVRQWETHKVRTTCSYCGVGCQLDLHVKDDEVVKVTGAEDALPNHGSLCVKGRFGYDFINSDGAPDTVPLVREKTATHRRGHLGRSPRFGRTHGFMKFVMPMGAMPSAC
jgi:anaerobic selenocysteine-containing dehydrogenase